MKRFAAGLSFALIALGSCDGWDGKLVITPTSVGFTDEHVELTRHLPNDAVGDLRQVLIERSKTELKKAAQSTPRGLRAGAFQPQRLNSFWAGAGGRPFEVWRVELYEPARSLEPNDTLVWHVSSKRALGWSGIFRPEALEEISKATCRDGALGLPCVRPSSLDLKLQSNGCDARGYKVHRITLAVRGRAEVLNFEYSGKVLDKMVRKEFAPEFGLVEGCPPLNIVDPVNSKPTAVRVLNQDELRLLIYGSQTKILESDRPDRYSFDGSYISGAPDQELVEGGRFSLDHDSVCVGRLGLSSCFQIFTDENGKYYIKYDNDRLPEKIWQVVIS